jgi:hypothetical protein
VCAPRPEETFLQGKKNWIGGSLIAGWIIVTLVVLASLSLRHMASLPVPADEARLSRAILKLRRGSGNNLLVHVIYSECSCARALFTHLVTRGPFPGDEELILFVGADPKKQASARRSGFEFTAISAQELVTRFGLEAAPVLLIFDSGGRLRYAGGYYAHPAAITPLDERMHTQFTAGAKVEPLPVFGCAVSPGLQRSLDPLRLVYGER